MIEAIEQPENRAGCQGVICPLASDLRMLEKHVIQMEKSILGKCSRIGLLFRLMADSLDGINAEVPAANNLMADTEETLRRCIALLMATRDSRGRYLFRSKSHWQGIYRIVVDRQLGVADGDYAGFESLAWRIEPIGCRIPFSPSALKQISKTNFTKPFARWCYDPVYFKTRKPYDQMWEVTTKFKELLEKHGL